MLFNSWVFGVFFFVVYLIYLQCGHRRQNILLLMASYIFYGFWDYRFLALIFLSTLVDYLVGLRLAKITSLRGRKGLLAISVIFNLGCLAFFKYCDFFIKNLNSVLHLLGIYSSLPVLGIIVPVGISFYTFQTMSYTIDVYRREIKECRNFFDFALFVSFFPQLVAGPIERAKHLIGQVETPRVLDAEKLRTGLWLILKGYFVKVFVADNLAKMVDPVFASANPSGAQSLLAVYAFAFQIYGDFAGYSNIARGLGSLMGFEIMVNFRAPYFAINPRDFWRRWHMSLSTWLRDYLYIPLGGNKGTPSRTYKNLMITMLLGGLWHGAEWKYILWGFYHGLLLVLCRVIPPLKGLAVPKGIRVIFYFHLTCFGWLIFRCNSLAQIWDFPRRIITSFGWTADALHQLTALCVFVAPVLFLDYIEDFVAGPNRFPRWNFVLRYAVYGIMFGLIYVLGSRGGIEFIYFQF